MLQVQVISVACGGEHTAVLTNQGVSSQCVLSPIVPANQIRGNVYTLEEEID